MLCRYFDNSAQFAKEYGLSGSDGRYPNINESVCLIYERRDTSHSL